MCMHAHSNFSICIEGVRLRGRKWAGRCKVWDPSESRGDESFASWSNMRWSGAMRGILVVVVTQMRELISMDLVRFSILLSLSQLYYVFSLSGVVVDCIRWDFSSKILGNYIGVELLLCSFSWVFVMFINLLIV